MLIKIPFSDKDNREKNKLENNITVKEQRKTVSNITFLNLNIS